MLTRMPTVPKGLGQLEQAQARTRQVPFVRSSDVDREAVAQNQAFGWNIPRLACQVKGKTGKCQPKVEMSGFDELNTSLVFATPERGKGVRANRDRL